MHVAGAFRAVVARESVSALEDRHARSAVLPNPPCMLPGRRNMALPSCILRTFGSIDACGVFQIGLFAGEELHYQLNQAQLCDSRSTSSLLPEYNDQCSSGISSRPISMAV